MLADIDPLITADLEVGCVTFRVHPVDAETIANLIRSGAVASDDEFVQDFAFDLIDQIHEAVHTLGVNPDDPSTWAQPT
jgi:hypothetical protein